MAESSRQRSLRRCRWQAPAGCCRWRVPAWSEFPWPWPHPNPCSPAFACPRCAAAPRERSPAAAAP
eukprot:913902-Rhodomonas_salina.1